MEKKYVVRAILPVNIEVYANNEDQAEDTAKSILAYEFGEYNGRYDPSITVLEENAEIMHTFRIVNSFTDIENDIGDVSIRDFI